jgi:arginine/lysine/ornithine decarboxylase
MKLTIDCKAYGYTGIEIADHLQSHGIYEEFRDPDYLVLMPSPENGTCDLRQLEEALRALPKRTPIVQVPPVPGIGRQILSPREAALSCFETILSSQCLGRILARATVGCPPAVPIVICGEQIDETALSCFSYYGIEYCDVIVQ